MKRLTKWNGKKYVLTNGQGFGQTRIFTDKLAAYENTGLEPYEIDVMIALFKSLDITVPKHSGKVNWTTRAFFEWLKEEMTKHET